MINTLASLLFAAQVVNPATAQTKPKPVPPPTVAQAGTHTWEMPPIEVFGKAPLVEEDLIGTYAQPRWTSHRRFSETRVYVIPEGMSDYEFWLIPETPKHGGPTTLSAQYEFEFGLPGRIQLDLYAVSNKTGQSGPMQFDEQKYEVRWAFADWGKIFGNPTLYAEWKAESNAPDHIELKLLLGGQLAPRWHWGSNFVYEHEIAGARADSDEWTTGLSYSARDSKVGVGLESQLALISDVTTGSRAHTGTELLLGPSVQFRPSPRSHLDIAPLFGLTNASSRSKIFVVFGWEF
jgi:hypothetical protein